MKKLLAFLSTLLISTACPSTSQDPKPFLAVFATVPINNPIYAYQVENIWQKFKPDYMVEATRWKDLGYFLRETRRMAQDRPILLDIDCHGGPDGYLSTTRDGEDLCSFGYLANKIDENLPVKNKTIILEACFAGTVKSISLHSRVNIDDDYYHVQNYRQKTLDFPCYGIDDVSSYDNMEFMQYYLKMPVFLCDLRYYNNPKPSKSKQKDLYVKSLDDILANFML